MWGCEPGPPSYISCPHCAFAGRPTPMGSSPWSPGMLGSPKACQGLEEEDDEDDEDDEDEDGSCSSQEEAGSSKGKWFLGVRGGAVAL